MSTGYAAVVGAVNMDICGTPYTRVIAKDSNPGTVRHNPGGVGRNIAHNLRLLGVPVKFLTAFGNDLYAAELQVSCKALGMDLSHAAYTDMATSSYLYITDEMGEMLLAVCDTDVADSINEAFLAERLDILNGAELVVFDGNLTEDTVRYLAEHGRPAPGPVPAAALQAQRAGGQVPGRGGNPGEGR